MAGRIYRQKIIPNKIRMLPELNGAAYTHLTMCRMKTHLVACCLSLSRRK